MSEKTTKIHQFNPQVYPRLLWIVVGYDNAVKASLHDYFGDFGDMDKDAEAEVFNVHCKKPKPRGGLLIWFRSKAAMTTGIITHESDHVAIEIFDYCNCKIAVDNQEPFTYLAGWVADCCDQVKRNKFKDE